MSRLALSTLVYVAVALAQSSAVPTFPATPLLAMQFPHPTDAPYKVFPDHYVRGTQSGFNICNSTTENQQSMCQTAYVNDITDFCLWAPQEVDSTIADTEGEEVAWCTKKGRGTRIMLDGTFKGLQVLNTPDYTMITGLIDQTLLNIKDGDFGGELDSGGQDLLGNPIGGLMYSNRFGSGPDDESQIRHWTEFIGNNQFCIKICNPNGKDPEGFCQHTLDRIGLAFNCPSKYTLGGGFAPGDFEVCDSDNMVVPGIYTLPDGTTTSYAQPAESLGPITTVPYAASAPASSNCKPFTSSAVYTDLLANTAAPTASGASASGMTAKPTGSASATGSASRSGSAGGASPTGASENSAADGLHVSVFATAIGTLLATLLFA